MRALVVEDDRRIARFVEIDSQDFSGEVAENLRHPGRLKEELKAELPAGSREKIVYRLRAPGGPPIRRRRLRSAHAPPLFACGPGRVSRLARPARPGCGPRRPVTRCQFALRPLARRVRLAYNYTDSERARTIEVVAMDITGLVIFVLFALIGVVYCAGHLPGR